MTNELEYLRQQNQRLTHMCQIMALLLDGMMQAAAKDNPELMTMPHYAEGQRLFEKMSLELREIQGEA